MYRETVEVNNEGVVKKVHQYSGNKITAASLVISDGVELRLTWRGQQITLDDSELIGELGSVLKDVCSEKVIKNPPIERSIKKG